MVWYASPGEDLKLSPKLRRHFIGPVVVINKFNDVTYEIQLNAKGSKRVVHHDKLLRYQGRENPKWIKKAVEK